MNDFNGFFSETITDVMRSNPDIIIGYSYGSYAITSHALSFDEKVIILIDGAIPINLIKNKKIDLMNSENELNDLNDISNFTNVTILFEEILEADWNARLSILGINNQVYMITFDENAKTLPEKINSIKIVITDKETKTSLEQKITTTIKSIINSVASKETLTNLQTPKISDKINSQDCPHLTISPTRVRP